MRKSALGPSSNLETALKHRRWAFTGCRSTPSPPKAPPRRSPVLTAALHHPCVQMRRAGIQSGWHATCLRSGRGLSFPGEGHPWGKWEGTQGREGIHEGRTGSCFSGSSWLHPEGHPGTGCRHVPQGPPADGEGPGEGAPGPQHRYPPPGITKDKDPQKETQTLQREASSESGLK